MLAAVPGLELVEDMSLVSVVGDGLASTTEPLSTFLRAVRSAGAEPRAVLASALRLGAVVAVGSADGVQRAVHAELVGAR